MTKEQHTKIYKKLNFFGDKRPLFAVVDQANVKDKHPELFQRMHDYTYTKTSRCTTHYPNDLKSFNNVDEAMLYADSNQYDIVLIQSIGNIIRFNVLLEHLAKYYNDNPDFYLVAFTLDWYPERGVGWIECHHQMMFVNVATWRKVGSPEFGRWETVTEELPVYSRSEENFHDKYTPYWIKGESGTVTGTRTSQGWGFIKAGLSHGLKIDNFTQEMRDCRLFVYPETDSDNLFKSTTDKDFTRLTNPNQKKWIKSINKEIPIWVFNSENYRFEVSLRGIKSYFGPAAGFKYLDLLLYNKKCKFIFYDYNQLSLDWLKHLVDYWDGHDIVTFLNNQDESFKSKFKYVHGDFENNETLLHRQFGGEEHFKELWLRFKECDIKFAQCNLYDPESVKKLLVQSQHEEVFFYYSNIFSTDFIFVDHTIEEVTKLYNTFKKTVIDRFQIATLFGTDEVGKWKIDNQNSKTDHKNLVLSDSSMNFAYIDGETLHTTSRNNWKGWHCSTGLNSIYIDFDGNVWRGTCRVGGFVGNVHVVTGLDQGTELKNGNWVVCTKDLCSCAADMNTPKVKNVEHIATFFPTLKTRARLKLLNPVSVDSIQPEIIYSKDFHRYKFISWDLGRRCNFDCWYCSKNSHNNYEQQKNLVELTHAYENLNKYWIDGTKTKFSFTGGEPAIYKDYLPFVKMLREKGHTIATTTNGSATEQYYAELVQYSSITFSIHLRYVEKFGLDKFTKAVRGAVDAVLKARTVGGPEAAMWVGVRIMLEPGYKDLAETCYNEFKQLFPSLNSVGVQGLHDQDVEQKIKVYAKEEMDWIVTANK
jgi:pyruvate-formate lyase-activating enzyme